VAILVAAIIGMLAVWLSVLLAYDSYYWPPGQRGWPVSFFVVLVIFLFYLLTQLRPRDWAVRRSARTHSTAPGLADR
jgi:zinc/manganese transport system permease protein